VELQRRQRRELPLLHAGKTLSAMARTIDAVGHPEVVAFLRLDVSNRIIV
jgi:hypothetical protein